MSNGFLKLKINNKSMKQLEWNKLRDMAHDMSVKHGFWENRPSDEHFLCLIVSELSEAVEADRKGRYANLPQVKKDTVYDSSVFNSTNQYFKIDFEGAIKDTVEDELADAAIRIFDLAGANNIDMAERMETKYSIMSRQKSFTENILTIIRLLTNPRGCLDGCLRLAVYQICALADNYGMDLSWHIEKKMEYNSLRAYKHGKKY